MNELMILRICLQLQFDNSCLHKCKLSMSNTSRDYKKCVCLVFTKQEYYKKKFVMTYETCSNLNYLAYITTKYTYHYK